MNFHILLLVPRCPVNKHKDKILEWVEFFLLSFVRKGNFSYVSGTGLCCMYVSGSPTGIRQKRKKKAIEDNKRSGDCDGGMFDVL